MQEFLASHGIKAMPKYLWTGSLKHRWRLYDPETKWTKDLAQKLSSLGFTNFDGMPLREFSGNGGMFSVFVCGHQELAGLPDNNYSQAARV